MLVRDEQPARLPVDPAELLAGLADDGRVDQRHHLGDVLIHQAVEEDLVAVLEVAQVDVLLQFRPLLAEVGVAAFELLLDRPDVRRQEPVEPEAVALLLGEGAALVEHRAVQQRDAPQGDLQHLEPVPVDRDPEVQHGGSPPRSPELPAS